MLAWRGGRRRLVREQNARRKLEGVFSAAAKISKPVSRSRVPATIEDLGEQFSALRARPTPDETNPSGEDLRNNQRAPGAGQTSSQAFRPLPAFPSLDNTGRTTGVSLDILAIQGGTRHLKTVFETTTEEEEISNETSPALEENSIRPRYPPAKKKQAPAPSFSKSKSKSKVSSDKKKYISNVDVEPMSLEL
jgi:hypothetical protein